jgi:hypothetical protein
MSKINDYIAANRIAVMKHRVRPLHHAAEIRRQRDVDNHIACQTEHMWYIARAVEQIAKKTVGFKHISPTESGKKGM